MAKRNGVRSVLKKPFSVFLSLVASIFIIEISLIIVLPRFNLLSPGLETLLYAFLLTILFFPILYLMLFRPLLKHIQKSEVAEEQLRNVRDELELSVVEGTKELKKINEELRMEINERKQAEEVLTRKNKIQKVLNTMLNISMKSYSLEEMLDRILDEIVAVPWLTLEKTIAIFLTDNNSDELVLTSFRELPDELQYVCSRVPFGKCICGRAALAKEVIFVNCIDERHNNGHKNMLPHGHYCIPICSGKHVIGVLTCYVKAGVGRKKEEEDFLVTVANVLVGIVQRKRAEEGVQQSLVKLRKIMGGIIQAITLTIEARDPYTAGHQRRVSNIARAIAAEMQLSNEKIDGVRMAGIVHDLGKISVPINILKKPGRLSKDEYGLIKTHTQVAFDILNTIEFPWPIAKIVYQHHERLNGSGYPLGLSGEEILIESRVLAVADVVEAMTSYRHYRQPPGLDKALEEIEKNKGILYDPDVADACLKIFREKGFTLEIIYK